MSYTPETLNLLQRLDIQIIKLNDIEIAYASFFWVQNRALLVKPVNGASDQVYSIAYTFWDMRGMYAIILYGEKQKSKHIFMAVGE